MNRRDAARAAKENAEKTVKSFTQIDDNLWSMIYYNSYGLDSLLKKGSASILDTVRHLQKEVRAPHIAANPDHGGFACSTFNASNPGGDSIMGRNFDYKAAPCAVVWTAPENGYRSVGMIDTTFFLYGTKYHPLKSASNPRRILGAPYMTMDGINEKGLACAILEIKSKATKQETGKTPIVTTVALRAALDKCANVDEALDLFTSYDMRDLLGINYHYQFADESGNTAILEYVDNKAHIIRPDDNNRNLKLTNYFLTPGGDNHDGRGQDRYEHIDTVLKEKGGIIGEDEAMKLLSECVLSYRHKTLKHQVITLWSAVYNCKRRSLLLSAGMDYSKSYTICLDRPGEVILNK